jgi:hypothetical protein
MTNIFYYLGLGARTSIEKALSVKEISELMTPIEEEKLKLPRSFAHNLRVIIDAEKGAIKNQKETLKLSECSDS